MKEEKEYLPEFWQVSDHIRIAAHGSVENVMLLSLNRRFVFVANLKTASSAIENYLRPFSDIAICQTKYGKHAYFDVIQRRFHWVFHQIPQNNFIIFGVIRDPVDYALSIYRSHQKESFKGKPIYTGNKSFEEFYEDWMNRRDWQMKPQSKRFLDKDGKFALNYLLDFAHIGVQWRSFCKILGVPAGELDMINVSPKGVGRDDIHRDTIERIRIDFADDYALMQTSISRIEIEDEVAGTTVVTTASASDSSPPASGGAPHVV